MRTCPRCSEENADRARFCSNCGEPLAEPEQRRRERKYATALFADLVGSTSLAENEDPEVVQSVVGRVFDRLTEEISRYEGLVEKFMGDAVLAVFGVPRAHEDDAERAVRAGLEMQAVLSELNHGFRSEGLPELAMRIGIESGEVLVDQDRVSGTRDRMLTGDAVNVAARLQGAAEPGWVIVGPGTYAATKDVIEYRDMPPLELKGKAERVSAWLVLRVRAKQRGERPQLGMEATLVGRDEELAVLKQTFQRVQNEGRPALVTVIGPAGVGKSRLVRELERYADGLPGFVYWRRGRCLAYGNSSYSALADAIKAQCEILEDDPTEVALTKVDAAVQELFGDDSVARQVRALVGAGEVGSFSREDLFDAWRRFLERMSARYPLAIVLEDIHWADAGLLDFIEHAADWAQGPILIVALARPELFELRPSWGGGKRNTTSIYLDPLTQDESETMLEDLLSGAVDPGLAHTIVGRSEGNPLYVEEIVRKLIDDGVLRAAEASHWEVARSVADIELPRSIQALIATRIDVLPDDEKAVLQDASVVGRVFWAGAVESLTGRSLEDVRETLGRLRVKELVVPIDPPSFSDEHEFTFRHALIRDGAYDSLPKSLRADKHAETAGWAERRAGDRADEIAPFIATHDLEALRYLEELGTAAARREELERHAYLWVRTAGDRAMGLWLAADASRWFEHALRLGDAIGAPAVERARIARSLLGAAFGASTEVAEYACHRAIDLAREEGDDLGTGWALAWLMLVLLGEGREDEAPRYGDEALAILEPLGETRELAEALRVRGQFYWRIGDVAEAEPSSRRAAEIAARVDAIDIQAAAVQDLAVELSQSGRSQEAVETIEDAFRLAEAAGDRINLQRAYNNFASVLSNCGVDIPRAKQIAIEGSEMARKAGGVGWLAWIEGTHGEIEAMLGNLEEAEVLARAAIEDADRSRDEALVAARHVALGQILLLRGSTEEAREEATRSVAYYEDRVDPQMMGLLGWVRGTIALLDGDDPAALAHLRIATESLRRFTVDQDPFVMVDLVRLLRRRGDVQEAARVRDVLRAGSSPFARSCLLVADALVADRPDAAIASLRDAIDQLDAMGRRIDMGRALLDLGRAQRAAGEDPSAAFERAHRLFVDCGAELYVPEADVELG